jgi:hypothetical protein
VDDLWGAFENPEVPDRLQTNFLKKFLNFVGQGVDEEGHFLKKMRRAQSSKELFEICDHWLIENRRAELPFAAEPYTGVIARPNQEGELVDADSCSLRM